MRSVMQQELKAIFAFSKRNYNEFAVISLATLFLMLAGYHRLYTVWFDSLFYYGLLPILSIVVLLRKNPLDFGLRLGNWKVWVVHLLMACPVIFLLIYPGASTEAVQRYYRGRAYNFNPWTYMLVLGVQLWGWEYLFRGFMLFGLRDKLKENAIFVQMIPFALLHMGKPEAETISCIFSGIYFGYLCHRGNSFWPAFLLHCFINYSTVFLVVYWFSWRTSALKVLNGTPPADISYVTNTQGELVINISTDRRYKLVLPEALLASAARISE